MTLWYISLFLTSWRMLGHHEKYETNFNNSGWTLCPTPTASSKQSVSNQAVSFLNYHSSNIRHQGEVWWLLHMKFPQLPHSVLVESWYSTPVIIPISETKGFKSAYSLYSTRATSLPKCGNLFDIWFPMLHFVSLHFASICFISLHFMGVSLWILAEIGRHLGRHSKH